MKRRGGQGGKDPPVLNKSKIKCFYVVIYISLFLNHCCCDNIFNFFEL
jgi:hypothetical protein